jgi:hypothetical protein
VDFKPVADVTSVTLKRGTVAQGMSGAITRIGSPLVRARLADWLEGNDNGLHV